MKFNRFLECYLHSVLLFWHPTHKPKKQPYGSTNHGPLLNCFFYCFFVLWYVCFFVLVCELDAKAKGQKADSIAKIVCVFSMFLKFLPNISKTQWKKTTNQWRSMKGGPMSTSTQPHLTDIIQVCMFC